MDLASLIDGADLSAVDHAKWSKLAEKALGGKSFESLVGHTDDGLRIEPVYPRAATAQALPRKKADAPWLVVQRADHTDPATANAQIREDIDKLAPDFDGPLTVYGEQSRLTPATLDRERITFKQTPYDVKARA